MVSTYSVFNKFIHYMWGLVVRCPFCSSKETKVVETRKTEEDGIRRRRECLKCSKRFTTYERIENFSLRVIKKGGNREFFDKEKLRKGMLRACEKRPVSHDDIDRVVNDIEKILRNKYSPEVKSAVIGNLIMKNLKKLDSVAYIRFASVYRAFQDIGEFAKEVKLLKNTNHNHTAKLSNNKKRS